VQVVNASPHLDRCAHTTCANFLDRSLSSHCIGFEASWIENLFARKLFDPMDIILNAGERSLIGQNGPSVHVLEDHHRH
jgi:hypothetical protein